MKSTIKRKRLARAVILAAACSLSCGTLLNAVPGPAPLVNPTGAGAPAAAPTGVGLGSLDDHAVAAELSSRGLTSLLDHYFKINNTPDAEQQTIKTFGALRELQSPGAKISVGEKMRRVSEVAAGIDMVMKSLKDPTEMLQTAHALNEFGVDPAMDDIENWGEDSITQATLKPLADAVVKLLDGAAVTSRKQADQLSELLKGGNDPRADRWEALDLMANTAAYNKQLAVYPAAAARSLKDPERKKLANDAITALKEFDDDQHGVQPQVRNAIAKLAMVSGDYDKAIKTFATVSAVKGLTPEPNPYEQKEARYFTVVCDILARNLAGARTDEAALATWETTAFAPALQATKIVPAAVIAADVKRNAAAEMLLQWRIDMLEQDLAKPGPERDKAGKAAELVMAQLREGYPALGPRIDQELVKRSKDAKIDDKMATSLIVALEKKAIGESYKKGDEKPDPDVLKKGIEAARAIVARKGTPGVTPAVLEEAQLTIAQLSKLLGDKVAAANAFIDYAQANYALNPTKATQAIGAAGFLVMDDMKKMQPNAPAGFAEVYARFQPIAINPPYSRLDMAFDYAQQLRILGKYADALRYYQMVPKTDPMYSWAKYKEMQTLTNILDTKQDPVAHKQTVTEILAVAEEVKKLSDPPKDDADRNHALDAIGLLADLYRIEMKDPNRTLQTLEGYDALVDGLTSDGKTPQEVTAKAERKAALKHGALVSRINADMALGKSNEAVQEVTKLLDNAKGEEGIDFVKVLLSKLDKDFAAADLVHNTAVMKETARNSALLTGYLVTYSDPRTQKNPKIAKYYYAYVVYDAKAQRIAGSLTDDPAERKKLLEKAAERFRMLLTPAMHALYVAQDDVKNQIALGKVDTSEADPQVQTGLALTAFDLGEFKECREQLNPIIAGKKLGAPQITTPDGVKDNDLYWEAEYKFIKSVWEVGKADPQAKKDAGLFLKGILLLGGIPERWQDEFDGLHKEIMPDFNPDHPTPQKSAATPATQPAK